MSTKLGKIVANFQAQLSTKVNVGDTTATINSSVDDDGVTLENGRYFITMDVDNNKKEHFSCVLTVSGDECNLTDLKTINRVTSAETAGALRQHRVGSKVAITDFATILVMQRILDGLQTLNGASPIGYDVEPTLADREQIATVGYVLDVATGGSLAFDTQTISSQTAGEDGILVNDLVYFKTSDAKWYKVQADAEDTYTGVQVGFSKTEADENEAIQVAISGTIKNLSGLTAGLPYYASDTPGEISSTPGTAPFVVGYALSTTQLLFTVDFLLPSVKEKAAMSGGGYLGTPSSTNKFITEELLNGGVADGTLNVTSGTTTIDLGGLDVVIKNYESINISSGATVNFTNPHANGTRIIFKSKGDVTIEGTIDASGMGASGGAGGVQTGGGFNGGNGNTQNGLLASDSINGKRGTYNSTSESQGGSVITLKTFYAVEKYSPISGYIHPIPGAGGGGGSAGQRGDAGGSGGVGGAGGRGGGAFQLFANKTLTFTGTINTSGLNGGNGGNAIGGGGTNDSASNGGGGGGGGSAGMCVLIYRILGTNTGIIIATGGNGGNGGLKEFNSTAGDEGEGGGGAGSYYATGGNGSTNSFNSGSNAGGLGAGGGGGAGRRGPGIACPGGTGGGSMGGLILKNTMFS